LIDPRLDTESLSEVGLEELGSVVPVTVDSQEVSHRDDDRWVLHALLQSVLPDGAGIESFGSLDGSCASDLHIRRFQTASHVLVHPGTNAHHTVVAGAVQGGLRTGTTANRCRRQVGMDA